MIPSFFVDLSNLVNSDFSDHRGRGSILDNEVCGGPSLVANTSFEVHPGGSDASGNAPPGWTPVDDGGQWQRLRGDQPAAYDGRSSLVASSVATGLVVATAEILQDVEVTTYAAPVDAGGQVSAFSAMISGSPRRLSNGSRFEHCHNSTHLGAAGHRRHLALGQSGMFGA